MRESMMNSRVRLLPAAEAFDPVGHMRGVPVPNESRRDSFAARESDVFLGALNEGVVFTGPFLFYPFPARAPFASNIDECGVLSHDPAETVAVVAEAGRVTDQESLRIFQERLECI